MTAWEGVAGGIIINGPSTANYDHGLGVLFLSDWTHRDVDLIYSMKERIPLSVQLENGLINGTNTYNDTGSRFQTIFSPGESYRLRLVNNAIETMWGFMIDNHTLTVMAVDFVPIVPYRTKSLSLTIGQRYDVVVEADATPGDYWLRAIPLASCSALYIMDSTKGIVRYSSESIADPQSVGYTDYKPNCTDEDLSDLVPYVKIDVGDSNVIQDTLELEVLNNTNRGVFQWFINGNNFNGS
jgi:FtsP/CotA-like multicopper oxidase with cupredoxin domain